MLVVGEGPNAAAAAVVRDAGDPRLRGAIVHTHLRFFEREHLASALAVPGDRFRGERMLRAGVRIELVDRVTYDYFPSSLWR